jgi:hypothetical protein
LLSSAQSDVQATAHLNIHISTSNVLPIVVQALARKFSHAIKPAVSFVVTPLPEPTARVAMDAVSPTRIRPKLQKAE